MDVRAGTRYLSSRWVIRCARCSLFRRSSARTMKRALLIAAVDPGIGGVMVFGDRGTGKSTAVRALAALLPEMRAVKGCAYHCDPNADAGTCIATTTCASMRISWTRAATGGSRLPMT